MKKIRIECSGHSTVPFHKLLIIQKDLKSLSEKNFLKLRSAIEKDGFSFAIHVWKDPKGDLCVLDGTQRLRVIGKMIEEGWMCPELPVVYVEAKNYRQAAKKLLEGAGSYGKPDAEGLYEFLHEFELEPLDLDEVALPGIDNLEFSQEYFEDTPTEYADPSLQFTKEIDEKNDYIVLLFNSKKDFAKACELLKIERVNVHVSASKNEKFITQGVGRIIDGKKVLPRLRDSKSEL